MKSLETYAGQEIPGLREIMIKIFEMIEEIIGAGEQSKKTEGQDNDHHWLSELVYPGL